VAYNAFGGKHTIVLAETLTKDSLLSQIHKNESNLEVPRSITSTTMRNAYGIPNSFEDRYFDLESTIQEHVQGEIYDEATQQLTSATLNVLSETLPDFVTFNSSIVDQMQWERVADVELSDGTSEAECNFWALVNEFCCNAILPPMIGAQFTESYQLLATDLATFNRRYWALALGLPRLSPIQGLPGAALAQKRLTMSLAKLFRDITNPTVMRVPDDDESMSGEETDADVLTPMTKLNEVFTKHDLPIAARASIALQIVHGVVADVVPLVFWTLVHIYASPSSTGTEAEKSSPLEKIKQETGQWAQAIQPPSIHPSFPAPPEIVYSSGTKGNVSGKFPYLYSCINEARRLYGTSNATYQVKKPFTINEASVRRGETDEWEIEAGSYIDIGLSQLLINSSPTVFPEPATYKPDRSLANPSSRSSITSPTDKAEPYKTSLIIAIVTGIIQLWEIAPAPKKTFFDHMNEAREEAQIGAAAMTAEEKAAKSMQMKERRNKESKETKWKVPKAVDGSCVKVPKGDIRVRVRRREGLLAKAVVRR
jgi:hypothetical protein